MTKAQGADMSLVAILMSSLPGRKLHPCGLDYNMVWNKTNFTGRPHCADGAVGLHLPTLLRCLRMLKSPFRRATRARNGAMSLSNDFSGQSDMKRSHSMPTGQSRKPEQEWLHLESRWAASSCGKADQATMALSAFAFPAAPRLA